MNEPDHHPYYYKWLNLDLSAIRGSGKWKKRGWMPAVDGALVPCRNGYHACTPEGLAEWIGPTLWRIEIRGDWIWKDKGQVIVVRQARILSQVTQWNERTARLFAAECARIVVDRYWTNPADDRPMQAIQAAIDYAEGRISAARLQAAARDVRAAARAAGAAAWAARAAARAAWAARAAEDAAWDAHDSAHDSARAAARAARAAAWATRAAGTAWTAARAEQNKLLITMLSKQEG